MRAYHAHVPSDGSSSQRVCRRASEKNSKSERRATTQTLPERLEHPFPFVAFLREFIEFRTENRAYSVHYTVLLGPCENGLKQKILNWLVLRVSIY